MNVLAGEKTPSDVCTRATMKASWRKLDASTAGLPRPRQSNGAPPTAAVAEERKRERSCASTKPTNEDVEMGRRKRDSAEANLACKAEGLSSGREIIVRRKRPELADAGKLIESGPE